jgi:hypothetical protein
MVSRIAWLAVLSSSWSLACGGAVTGRPSAPDAAPAPVDAAPEAEAAPIRPPDPITCAGGTVLTFNKGCATNADCVLVTLDVGCCHSDAVGCKASDAARLIDAGAACTRLDPCDCSGNVITADDGRTSTAPNQSDVVVTCTSGICLSSVP